MLENVSVYYSFLWLNHSIVWIYHILYIHLSVEDLGYFSLGVNTAENISVQVFCCCFVGVCFHFLIAFTTKMNGTLLGKVAEGVFKS